MNEWSMGWELPGEGIMYCQLLSVHNHSSLKSDWLCQLLTFRWLMYLGLVFFTDIPYHKTGTSFISCTSLFLPHPVSFKMVTGRYVCCTCYNFQKTCIGQFACPQSSRAIPFELLKWFSTSLVHLLHTVYKIGISNRFGKCGTSCQVGVWRHFCDPVL